MQGELAADERGNTEATSNERLTAFLTAFKTRPNLRNV